ncbi:MAG: pesticidal protein Cry7Aa [Candidatus Shapirobacteria bacterium]|jgi:predicted GH43/DUF377 family glycosyl hydrolase
MIKIRSLGKILEPRDNDFERGGVLNPACVVKDGITHMFYRAVDEKRASTIGYCQLKENQIISRMNKPLLTPEYDFEREGLEDPRITYLDGIYYMFYTAFDGLNARIAYATSDDLIDFKKRGLISPSITYDLAEDIFFESVKHKHRYSFFEKLFKSVNGEKIMLWEKDASLFPKKFNGKYALFHRVLPGIQICYFEDFEELKNQNYWANYLTNLNEKIVLDPCGPLEKAYIGGGCTPILTEEGWLIIYHAVDVNRGKRVYRASAALLDKDNPQKVIGRLKSPLFEPQEEWETDGVVDNVVFPTGAAISGKMVYIYYGAADTVIGGKAVEIKSLIDELVKQ